MRGTWRALAWKEWRELRWKLVAAIAVVCGANAGYICLYSARTVEACEWLTFLSALPLTIFIAANAAASERSHSTAPFLNALPLSLWKPGVVKLIGGALTLMGMITIAFLFIYTIDRGLVLIGWAKRSAQFPNLWYVHAGTAILMAVLSIFFWVTAAGVNRADEISAGAKGIIIIFVYWALFVISIAQLDADHWEWAEGAVRPIMGTLVGIGPGGASLTLSNEKPLRGWYEYAIPAALVFHLGLAGWFVWRYERPGRGINLWFNRLRASKEKHYWPRPPRKSQIGAIVWKQLRESGPVILAGLAGIVALTCGFAASRPRDVLFFSEIIGGYAVFTAVFSFILAIVVGISVALNDMSSQVNTFWRSRPIDPNRWFWIKYTTGLVILFAALFVPLFTVILLGHLVGYDDSWSAFWQPSTLAIVAAVISIYTAAIAAMSVLRSPIYAAIFSVAFVYACYFASVVTNRWLFWGEPIRTWRSICEDDVFTTVVLVCTSVLVAIFGWFATRYDWGWGGSR